MPKFYLRKLVRDNVLKDCLKDPPIKTDYKVLDDEEFVRALIHKIIEEAEELLSEAGGETQMKSWLSWLICKR